MLNDFAKSDQGQNFFDLLICIGHSPKQFGELGWDEQRFYISAWNRKNTKRKNTVSTSELKRMFGK